MIATKTKISVDGINLSEIDDKFFAREKVVKKQGEEAFFDVNAEPKKNVISPERLKIQNTIDAELASRIGKVEMLTAYLQAKFSLSKSDKPHALVF